MQKWPVSAPYKDALTAERLARCGAVVFDLCKSGQYTVKGMCVHLCIITPSTCSSIDIRTIRYVCHAEVLDFCHSEKRLIGWKVLGKGAWPDKTEPDLPRQRHLRQQMKSWQEVCDGNFLWLQPCLVLVQDTATHIKSHVSTQACQQHQQGSLQQLEEQSRQELPQHSSKRIKTSTGSTKTTGDRSVVSYDWLLFSTQDTKLQVTIPLGHTFEVKHLVTYNSLSPVTWLCRWLSMLQLVCLTV